MEEKVLEKLWMSCPCVLCTGEIMEDDFQDERLTGPVVASAAKQ